MGEITVLWLRCKDNNVLSVRVLKQISTHCMYNLLLLDILWRCSIVPLSLGLCSSWYVCLYRWAVELYLKDQDLKCCLWSRICTRISSSVCYHCEVTQLGKMDVCLCACSADVCMIRKSQNQLLWRLSFQNHFMLLVFWLDIVIWLFPGPFRATQIWNEIISHVKSKVELKRRRYKMRHYDNTFTGTDAVDVVLHYLLSDKETFCTDLSRDKAVKVWHACLLGTSHWFLGKICGVE